MSSASPYAVHHYGPRLSVSLIPSWQDNYCYLMTDKQSGQAALVDASDKDAVNAALSYHFSHWPSDSPPLRLSHVFTTHKHMDHSAANPELLEKFPQVKIFGSAVDNVAACNSPVKSGDIITFGDNLSVRVFEAPCHTRGHLLFLVETQNPEEREKSSNPPIENILFTGDTLFLAGCGRFFEGSAAEMYKNLVETIGKLDGKTKYYPGHEYTVANLEFAAWVEPDNQEIKDKMAWSQAERAAGRATVPGSVAEEWKINPFMRVGDEKALEKINERVGSFIPANMEDSIPRPIRILQGIREAKNQNAHKPAEK